MGAAAGVRYIGSIAAVSSMSEFRAALQPCRASKKINQVPIDGRPRFVKRSLNDGEKVKIAAIDPDFV